MAPAAAPARAGQFALVPPGPSLYIHLARPAQSEPEEDQVEPPPLA